MDSIDWTVLSVLFKSKSMSKASQQLFISQPAITRRIQQIEKEFSVPILIRSAKGITFTPQGTQLAYYAKEMLGKYENIKEIMKAPDEIGGIIHLVASSSQSQFFLPELLQRYKTEHQNVRIELESMLSSRCVEKIVDHTADVAFFRGNHSGNFIKESLGAQLAYIAYSKPFEIKDLPHMPYISVDADHSGTSIRDGWWYDMFSVAPYEAMSVKNVNICYEMVRHGLGFGIFLYKDMFRKEDNVYIKQIFYKNGAPVTREDWFGYRKEALENEPSKSFIKLTRKYFLSANR